MTGRPRTTSPVLRFQGPLTIALAVVGGAIAHVAFGQWFAGWSVGLLFGLLGGPALARRRPDLAAESLPAGSPRWQLAVVALLLVAVLVALTVALSN